MLKSILTFPRFRGFLLSKRVPQRAKGSKKPDKPGKKDPFKEKGKSEENRYFVKEYAEQVRNLREYLKRIEDSQKKLKLDLDETNRLLQELQDEEEEAAEKAEEEAKQKKKEKEKRWK